MLRPGFGNILHPTADQITKPTDMKIPLFFHFSPLPDLRFAFSPISLT